MGQKPPISAESEKLDNRTLEELCLNVGTLATVYLKPVQQVFRNARTRRLQYSPALQKSHEQNGSASMLQFAAPPPPTPLAPTPTGTATITTIPAPGPGSLLTANTNNPSPNDLVAPSPTTGLGPDAADMNAAVNAADSYFNDVGSQQMAAMDLGGRREDGTGMGGGLDGMGSGGGTQYLVSQNQQPQVAGGAATGELLLL